MKNISILYRILALPLFLIIITACKEENTPVSTGETFPPEIVSLTADLYQTTYGSSDPITITCEATGGNLEYMWEVDLGDIFPINEDNSKIRYTGSSCCVGEKVIKCTASNDKGSVSKDIQVTILGAPEIFAFETDNTIIGPVDTTVIKCFAAGGQLKYEWQASCGKILPLNEDGWEVEYIPNFACIGVQTITCTVTNSIGYITKTVEITVK